MPIYAYECHRGHRFDVRHGMAEEPPVVCPTCKSRNVERRIAAPAVARVAKGATPRHHHRHR